MQITPIFFSFDNNYVPQAAVTFESLLTNAKPDIFYKLYVIHSGIDTSNRNALLAQVSIHQNATLDFIDVSGKFNIDFSNQKFCTGHVGSIFTVETLYRCLPMLLPEFDQFDQIIYSDVDIVVVDDISEFSSINITNSYIAGIHLPHFLNHQVSHLPQNIQDTYIGGGLWIMNLKKMREANLGKKILDILENPPCRLIWNDQDVINLACSPHIQYISYRYCSIPSWRELLKEMQYEDERYPNKAFYDATYRPKIIHYAAQKPWAKIDRPPLSDIWYYWLSKTSFAHLFNENIESSKPTVYLLNFIKLPLSWVKIKGNQIKVKCFGFIPLFKLKK